MKEDLANIALLQVGFVDNCLCHTGILKYVLPYICFHLEDRIGSRIFGRTAIGTAVCSPIALLSRCFSHDGRSNALSTERLEGVVALNHERIPSVCLTKFTIVLIDKRRVLALITLNLSLIHVWSLSHHTFACSGLWLPIFPACQGEKTS